MTAALASMTGFARSAGSIDTVPGGLAWGWELRSVNGRGLDLRFRLPAGWDALEPVLRDLAGKQLKRGNVTANLTLKREIEARLAPDPAALEQALVLVKQLHARMPDSPPPRAEALLALPGVLRPAGATDTTGEPSDAAIAALRDGFATALTALVAARQAEGGRLRATLDGLLDEIAALHRTATSDAADQPAQHRARMLENVQSLLRETPALPEERIAQEVAILAARSDVREELDRLASHIEAARALLKEAVGIGRRFDFLVQEFMREANTLCSKSATKPLTATGLKLKAVIEQLREQVQNIE
ncbi:MAG TPA: YicC/YloC family endoribonuclease [Acetobacteraceae bacterium]|jgi:uncharacterized protein (TIGR00255 family)|nr:YicC/YloC family endoribonuclease [Acetobacteraceae bacterium]